ncbi:S-layer homology domain-containing protein [Anaerovorax odorimutans]|uniref:S-layer homology domain-containing protein n=1 Tax=Anaerovorax odorimutans TaxID=109327 RepID=UPI0003FA3676|nr:S-layer homology domain-containing protein [Anaerovorax odorimutans]
MISTENFRLKKLFICLIIITVTIASLWSITPQNVNAAEPVALTVKGDGVLKEVEFTMSDLKALPQKKYTYSGYNHWPALRVFNEEGPTLKSILDVAGLKDSATLLKFKPNGGKYVHVDFTVSQLLEEQRYYFPDGEQPGDVVSWPPARSEKGKVPVETIIGLDDSNGRICFGQRAPNEPTGGDCVMIQEIVNNGVLEVTTEQPDKWEAPTPDIAPGKVEPGTKVSLIKKEDVPDNVMMYYTVDGSDPDYGSSIFNISYPTFQPALNAPIPINENTTIKARTIGFGKLDSDIVTFQYNTDTFFSDVDNHWAKDDINYLAGKGIIEGTQDMKFRPNDQITRAELAEMLVNALNLKKDEDEELSFKDVPKDSKYYDDIVIVNKQGLITGYRDTSFAPDDKLQREQLATIVARTLKMSAGTVVSESITNQVLQKFNDQDNISSWAKESVALVVNRKMMNGTNENTFSPKTVLTRAQAASVMARLYKHINQET